MQTTSYSGSSVPFVPASSSLTSGPSATKRNRGARTASRCSGDASTAYHMNQYGSLFLPSCPCSPCAERAKIQVPDASSQASSLPLAPDPVASAGTISTDVNMLHMELLLHFSVAIYIPDLGEDDSTTRLILKTALTAPYLMHEVLALSALHLSTVRPDMSDWYHHQSVDLQTTAVTLFNSSDSSETRDSSVPRMLFSSMLGRHILAESLAYRGPDMAQFVRRFVQGVRVHRGTRAIAEAHGWEALLGSEIGPLMAKGYEQQRPEYLAPSQSFSQTSTSQPSSLSTDVGSACSRANQMIETALDDLKSSDTSPRGLRFIFLWPVLLSEEYLSLLEQTIPEAVAVLGKYAKLLQAGGHIWQVRNAGTYLEELTSAFSDARRTDST